MLRGFRNVFVKELKELVRSRETLLGMITLPLVMFPLMGYLIEFSRQAAQELAMRTPILILDNDGGIGQRYL